MLLFNCILVIARLQDDAESVKDDDKKEVKMDTKETPDPKVKEEKVKDEKVKDEKVKDEKTKDGKDGEKTKEGEKGKDGEEKVKEKGKEKKEPEPLFEMLGNPARVMSAQLKVLSIPAECRYKPIKAVSSAVRI